MTPFIIALVALVFAICFFALFPIIKRAILSNNFKRIFTRKVLKISKRNNFLHLENLKLQSYNDNEVEINQVICGKKYIYLIKDYCHFGILSGKANDNSWIELNKSKRSLEYVDNMFNENERAAKVFSRLSKINESMLVPVSLLNNECDIRLEKREKGLNFVVTLFGLKKLIKKIEKSDIASLDQEQLKVIVEELKDINENKGN